MNWKRAGRAPIHPYLWFLPLAIVYLAIAAHQPISIFATAGHDDAWFIRRAQDIWAGQWLGSYNQMTLMKGPVYPLFLALNKMAGISVVLSQALLYLVACLVLCGTLLNKRVSLFWVWIILIVLLFHPALFPTRVLRDDIYHSLTLLSVAGFMRLSIPATSFWRLLGLAALGSLFGLFWFTREEGIWLVPGALVLLGAGLWDTWHSERSFRNWAKRLALFMLAAALPYVVLASINQKVYGTSEVVDFKGSAFKQVIARLNGVSTGEAVAYLAVPAASRQAVYRVSPTFKELEPYFEDPHNSWKNPGCSIYPQTCGDFAGGWFAWALRSGVSQLGYYRSPEAANDFYNRVSADIEAACENGTLVCKPSPVSFMPPITPEGWRQLPRSVLEAVKISQYLRGAPLTGGPSYGDAGRLHEIDSFLGHPVRTAPQERYFALESDAHADRAPTLTCRSTSGSQTPADVRVTSNNRPSTSPQAFMAATQLEFTIPSAARCALSDPSDSSQVVELNDLLKLNQRAFELGKHRFYIARYRLSRTTEPGSAQWLGVKASLTKAYQLFVPPLTLAGLISLAAALWIGIRKNACIVSSVWWSLAFWTLYATRLVVLALVDVTSFPGINHLYLLPAFPILSLAALLSIWALIQAWNNKSGETFESVSTVAPVP